MTCDENIECGENQICMPTLLGEYSCVDLVQNQFEIEEQFQNFYPNVLEVPPAQIASDQPPGSHWNADEKLIGETSDDLGIVLYENYDMNKGVNIELGEGEPAFNADKKKQ